MRKSSVVFLILVAALSIGITGEAPAEKAMEQAVVKIIDDISKLSP